MATASSVDTTQDAQLLNLLEKKGLKKTTPRLLVLAFVAARQEATSRACLTQALAGQVDRSTLYRLLKTFIGKDILHQVLDVNGTTAYIIAPQQSIRHQMHFNCTRCNSLYCLQGKPMSSVQLPTGFKSEFSRFITYGICRDCNN